MEPILIGEVDIARAGKNCKILLGDIDGDGRMELVCVQPDGGIDDRYVPHMAGGRACGAAGGTRLGLSGADSRHRRGRKT